MSAQRLWRCMDIAAPFVWMAVAFFSSDPPIAVVAGFFAGVGIGRLLWKEPT